MIRKVKFEPISISLKILLLIGISLFPEYNDKLWKLSPILDIFTLLVLIILLFIIYAKELTVNSSFQRFIFFNLLLIISIWEAVKYILFYFGELPYYSDVPFYLVLVIEVCLLSIALTTMWLVFKIFNKLFYKIKKCSS